MEKYWREVSEKSVVERCWNRVLGFAGQKCWRRVLWKSVEEQLWRGVWEKSVAEEC